MDERDIDHGRDHSHDDHGRGHDERGGHGNHDHHASEQEAPHPHEAPGGPLVDYHVFATIGRALQVPPTDRGFRKNVAANEVLDRIEAHFKQLDWLSALARQTTLGDAEAQGVLSSWFDAQEVDIAPDARSDLPARARLSRQAREDRTQRGASTEEHGHHGEPEGMPVEAVAGPEVTRTLGLNVRALRELFLGAVYAAGGDAERRDRNLALVEATVRRSVGLLDVIHHHAVGGLRGLAPVETAPNVLDQLPRGEELTTALLGGRFAKGRPKLPPLLEINPVLECLGALREGTVGAGSASAFGEWSTATADEGDLTGLIDHVTPASVCAGETVTLHAGKSHGAKKFPKRQPTDYGVFFEPCGVPAAITGWSADAVTVEVPASASSGCVRFGRLPPSSLAGAAESAERQAVANFSACMSQFGLASGNLGPISLDPQRFCRPTICLAESANYVEVRHPPEIVFFDARDPAGRAVGTDGVEAGTPVTLSWDVRSDDDAPLELSISGSKSFTGLPAQGSLSLSASDMCADQQLRLEAVNSCGTASATLEIGVFRKLHLSPSPLGITLTGSGTLTIRASCPVPSDLTVALSAANPDSSATPARVTVPASVTIPAGQDRVTVGVSAALAGNLSAYVAALKHSQPAAVVTATAPGHGSAAAAVWVEPPVGQAKVVSPTNTDVVAVHMAVLHTGKVLMFSADDADFNHIDKVKTRVWDPATNAVSTPSFPYQTHKNLFCAGHSILGDGRVLVIGGHAIFAGGSAAKEVHTFDPISQSWTRFGRMQKDRWYPTVVTLADGRALIASGSEGGGPPTIFKGVVRDVEVFDPSTNGLTFFPNIHGDICMYPHMFVLPGGLLFFHSRNVSWLYKSGGGPWSPTSGSWSGAIPMNNPTTRTYPGMAACALLPLLPEDGYAARILMAGGGGGREHDMGSSTVATRTAEILDVDVPGQTGAWRTTSRVGSALFVTTPRFMSDAVLLPDGTVLIVNGAAAGKADDSHVSVAFAELFDPVTETFRPFTPVAIPRHYHGTALLLPDGRVAVAGHTKQFNKPPVEFDRKEVELISPPYLFRGPRPRIDQVAFTGASVGYGHDITVVVDRPGDIVRVALVRPGSVTHQLNTDQRYVGLAIGQRTATSLVVKAPPDGNLAPPGYYLLFVVDARGVPSVGRFVRVG